MSTGYWCKLYWNVVDIIKHIFEHMKIDLEIMFLGLHLSYSQQAFSGCYCAVVYDGKQWGEIEF